MSKLATYHQEGGRDIVFAILATHADGTVDIGPEAGPALVTHVSVSKEPAVGFVTLTGDKVQDADAPLEDPFSELMKLTKAELTLKAEELNIEISPGQNKAEIIKAILAAGAANPE